MTDHPATPLHSNGFFTATTSPEQRLLQSNGFCTATASPRPDKDDPMSTPTDLNTDADELRRAKVAALQQRRASATPTADVASTDIRRRRKSPAQGSKIAATAIGLTTMLGLVAAMGAATSNSSAAAPAASAAAAVPAAPVAPAQVIVMIHPAGSGSPVVAATTAGAQPAAVQPAAVQPIVLSAQPIVRQASASPAQAPAPAATTRGSK
jgi:hypothetical protein